ncbi:hypothetical protein YC2023_063476 [Brassica napus]
MIFFLIYERRKPTNESPAATTINDPVAAALIATGLKSRDSSLVSKKKNPSILSLVVAGRMKVIGRWRMLKKRMESNESKREQLMYCDINTPLYSNNSLAHRISTLWTLKCSSLPPRLFTLLRHHIKIHLFHYLLKHANWIVNMFLRQYQTTVLCWLDIRLFPRAPPKGKTLQAMNIQHILKFNKISEMYI